MGAVKDRCVYVSVVKLDSSLCTVDVSGGGTTVDGVSGGGEISVDAVVVCDEEVTVVACDEEVTVVACDEEVTVVACDDEAAVVACDDEAAVVSCDDGEAVVVLASDDDGAVVVSDEIGVVLGVVEVEEAAVLEEFVGVTIVERLLAVVDPALRDERSVVLLTCMRAISAPAFSGESAEEPEKGHMHAAGPEKAPRAAITMMRDFTMLSLLPYRRCTLPLISHSGPPFIEAP